MRDYAQQMCDIAECALCDDEGLRGLQRCDHVDYAAIAKRHIAAIKDQLKKGK